MRRNALAHEHGQRIVAVVEQRLRCGAVRLFGKRSHRSSLLWWPRNVLKMLSGRIGPLGWSALLGNKSADRTAQTPDSTSSQTALARGHLFETFAPPTRDSSKAREMCAEQQQSGRFRRLCRRSRRAEREVIKHRVAACEQIGR